MEWLRFGGDRVKGLGFWGFGVVKFRVLGLWGLGFGGFGPVGVLGFCGFVVCFFVGFRGRGV